MRGSSEQGSEFPGARAQPGPEAPHGAARWRSGPNESPDSLAGETLAVTRSW
jgi:hypothetical protein